LVGVGVAPGVALPSEHIACGRCRGREHDPFLGVESRCESSRARRRDGPTHDHSCEGKFALDRKDVGAIPSADLAADRMADLLEFERPALEGHSTAPHATEVNR